jgi:hypothetical protein
VSQHEELALERPAVLVEVHRWFTVLKAADGSVIKVVGDTGQGYQAAYESVEEYWDDNG